VTHRVYFLKSAAASKFSGSRNPPVLHKKKNNENIIKKTSDSFRIKVFSELLHTFVKIPLDGFYFF